MYFTENKELQRFEREMKIVPNFERKEVWEYADSCNECKNYKCKLEGCMEAHCPYLMRKIRSNSIITRDLVETFLLDHPYIPFAHRVIDMLAKYKGNKLFTTRLIGSFRFNAAFGIADDPGCAIEYTKVDDNTYWSGDSNTKYNQMVSIKDYPDLKTEDSEHIVDYQYEYQYCMNISYNEEGTPGKGSAIFLHCLGDRKPRTGGCVAVPEEQMYYIMKHVDPDCVVVIDSMKNLGAEF